MPSYLKGWKTYAVSAVGIVLAGLHATGYIDRTQFESLTAVVAFLTAMAVRNGIENVK